MSRDADDADEKDDEGEEDEVENENDDSLRPVASPGSVERATYRVVQAVLAEENPPVRFEIFSNAKPCPPILV